MSGHTPGRIAVNPFKAWLDSEQVHDGELVPVAAMLWPTELRSEDETRANANRLADCWNALEGLDPAAVADVVAAAKNINLTFDSYGKERLPEYVRKEFAPLVTALARIRGEG